MFGFSGGRAGAGLAVAALVTPLLLAGCGAQTEQAGNDGPIDAPTRSGAPAQSSAPEPAKPPAEPFSLTANVTDGATGVPVDTLITLTPKSGKVDRVTVTTTAKGRSTEPNIGGAVNDQGAWVADSRLDPGAKYTVTASGIGDDGTRTELKTSFSTAELTRKQEVFPTFTPVQGGPFGVAQPVVIQFDLPVTNKAEVERNLHLTSAPAQEGSWGWVSDKEVHYRPKEYWQPGTRIHLDANLNGVNAGDGRYGQESRDLDLTIGKRQSARVDIAAHTLTFTAEGKQPVTYPMSAGKPGSTTRSGTKVIMSREDKTKMNSETTGISANSADGYNMDVYYAMRVTQSGEFIHAAPWNSGKMGRVNASHGCVGMDSKDALAVFQAAQIGDPVEFVGSERSLEAGNGWTEWNLSWDEWKAKSATA